MRISQREARRNRKEIERLTGILEAQRRTWSQEYPGGSTIASCIWGANDLVPVAIRTARKLGHAVVCVGSDSGEIRFVALPHPKVAS